MSAAPLRVMLVDDYQVVRDGIKLLLHDTEDVVICAEASTARDAVATAAQALPDAVVMDVRLQDGSGIEATRDIRAARPATQVLMLTSFADDEALFASIMAGAAGYVLDRSAAPTCSGPSAPSSPARACSTSRKGVFDRLQGQASARTRSWPASPPGGTRPGPGRRRRSPTARSARSSAWPRRRSNASRILAKLEVARRRARLPGPPPPPTRRPAAGGRWPGATRNRATSGRRRHGTADARPAGTGGGGARLHGDEPVVRAGDDRESVAIHRALGSRDDVPGHRRHVRAVHQRAAGQSGDRGTARRGGAGDQVRQPARADGSWVRSTRSRTTCGGPATSRWSGSGSAIDLYYQHQVDRSVPVEDTWGAMAELVEAGRSGTGSRIAGDGARRSPMQSTPSAPGSTVVAVHPRPRGRGAGHPARLGIGVVAYGPLGRGFLSGRITSPDDFGEDDFRRSHPGSRARTSPINLELVERVKQLAAGKGDHGQLAIAWVLAQGDDVVPIPGTKRRRYLEETPAPSRSAHRRGPGRHRGAPPQVGAGRALRPQHMANVDA